MITVFYGRIFRPISKLVTVLNPYLQTAFSSKMPKPGYYGVKIGRIPGIYTTWSECEAQVKGFPNASYKKFPTLNQASEFVRIPSKSKTSNLRPAVPAPIPEKRSTSSRSTILIPAPQNDPGKSSTATITIPEETPEEEFWCEDFDSFSSDSISDINILLASERAENQLIYPPAAPKHTFYAVHRGARPGVYRTWSECEAQIKNSQNVSYRKFDNEEQALEYVRTGGITKATKRELEHDPSVNNRVFKKLKTSNSSKEEYVLENPNRQVVIYTDGASSQNGRKRARAGIGVYWGPNHPLNASKRLTGRQTNNRAEIHAAVYALNQAKEIGAKKVKIYTDSQFLIHSITDWIKKWKTNGWKLVNGQDVVNKDDFIELEAVSEGLDVEWVYVRAHARNHGNEEADRLAVAGARLLMEPKNFSSYPKPSSITNIQDRIKPFLITSATDSDDEEAPLIIPESQVPRTVYYAVHRGNMPGVYTTWTECEEQIKDCVKPYFRKFTNVEEAREFVKSGKVVKKLEIPAYKPNEFVTVYTDGASSCNGQEDAKAGIGVYWGPGNDMNTSMRLPGRQSNNRAEIFAAVHALNQAKQLGIKNVRLYTDSKFVINGITSWIEKWKQNGWKLASGKPVVNKEEFIALDTARTGLNVDWCYVKGHDNNPGNVEADKLAVAGCSKKLSDTFMIA